jgi:hypothetical protein
LRTACAPEDRICVKARQLDEGAFVPHAKLAGATPMLEWLGDADATVFRY